MLGARALRIEHVGSTSVPGLPAKPIIDLVLGLADSSDESAYVRDLQAAGYVLRIREPDWFEHRLFKGPRIDINLHVFSANCSESSTCSHSGTGYGSTRKIRELYASTKRTLVQQTWKYMQNYADSKTAVIREI